MEIIKNTIHSVERLSEVAKRYVPSKEVYPVGYHEFDHCMDGGLREGELITISGSSGEGKTSFAQAISVNLSKSSVPSLWFSFEMTPHYLYDRFCQIDTEPDDLLIYAPIELIANKLLFIEQEIRVGVEQKAIKVVFIDHLHYLLDLKSSVNSSLMIGGIVRELKNIAVRNNVVIFLIAHARKINQGDDLNASSVRDSSLVVCESDYLFLVERRRKKKSERDKKKSDYITSGDEFLDESRITLAKNRRTGKIFFLDFKFVNGKFLAITDNYGLPLSADENF